MPYYKETKEEEKTPKEMFEIKLLECLQIVEATIEWSEKFYLVIKNNTSKLNDFDEGLYFMTMHNMKITCLSQHYNQLYFCEAMTYLMTIISNDVKEISINGYIDEFIPNNIRAKSDRDKLFNKFKAFHLLHLRNWFIDHKNSKIIESVLDLTWGYIHYDNIIAVKEMIVEIKEFMENNFEYEHSYLKLNGSVFSTNEYKIRYENSIEELLSMIKDIADKYYLDNYKKYER